MSDNNIKNRIGLGIYTLQEAAFYSGISTHKLSNWIFGASNKDAVIEAQFTHQHLVSFLDLIQSKVIENTRARGVSLRKIREAIKIAKSKYNLDYPFARNNLLILFDGDIHVELAKDNIQQLTGKNKGQMALRPIIEPFMKYLDFGGDGLAIKYSPFSKYGRKIVLNPNRQFGQPIVENIGYRADILANAYNIEGSEESVADEFNIDIDDVRIAVDYIKKLGKVA